MMDKRFSLVIVIPMMCVLLCACAAPSVIELDINQGIFDLSSCLPGYVSNGGCNYFTYRLNDIRLSLSVYDNTAAIAEIYPGALASFEARTENGMDYYFRSYAVCWDGIDEETGEPTGGEITTTEIIFYIDEYIVVLSGSTDNDDVSAVTLTLAMDLLSEAPIEDLEQVGGGLSTRYYNGILECNISLIAEDDPEYQRIFDTEGTVIQEEGNIRYLASIRERSPDDPNRNLIVCDTDKGALLVSCGVPYSKRNNVSSKELDFINFSLAKNIAESLGVVINSLG